MKVKQNSKYRNVARYYMIPQNQVVRYQSKQGTQKYSYQHLIQIQQTNGQTREKLFHTKHHKSLKKDKR